MSCSRIFSEKGIALDFYIITAFASKIQTWGYAVTRINFWNWIHQWWSKL